MKSVLVSLVGDQTVPNVFLILDDAFRGVDEYLFLTTPLMEERERLPHILRATGLPEGRCRVLQVAADELSDIYGKLDALRLPGEGVRYYVNLTSGTKLMSIALFDYFARGAYASCSSIFYIPIGRNAYVQVQKEGRPLIRELTYRISVWEYLASYGIELAEARKRPYQPSGYSLALMPKMQALRTEPAFAKALHGLRQAYNRNRDKGEAMSLEIGPELSALLEQLDYPLGDKASLSAADARYLTGGWLEEWAYHKVQSALSLPDSALALNALVTRSNRQGGQVSNECDLLFTHNNTLYVLECKTGLGKRGSKLFDEAVYKLATLRGEFGQRVPALLLTLDGLKPSYQQRAALHRIELLGGSGVEIGLEKYLEGLG